MNGWTGTQAWGVCHKVGGTGMGAGRNKVCWALATVLRPLYSKCNAACGKDEEHDVGHM